MPLQISVEMPGDAFGKFLRELDGRAVRAVNRTAARIESDSRQRVQSGSKTGHLYTSGPAPLPHQASAPGESPADWTGDLADAENIVTIPAVTTAGGEAEAFVAYRSDHAAAMEFGTVHIAARPFIAPAAADAEGFLAEQMRGGAAPGGDSSA